MSPQDEPGLQESCRSKLDLPGQECVTGVTTGAEAGNLGPYSPSITAEMSTKALSWHKAPALSITTQQGQQ